ncbi:putative retrotransposon ty1-copia subclass protein [Tanacetum coccineum]
MPSPSVPTFSFPSTTEPVFSVSTSEPVFESPNHSQTSQTTQSQQLQQYHTTTVSNNNAKFPYLKKEEYETWAMKMEYWIMNSDHNLWNIVLNGNSRKKTGRDPKGNIMILPPVSVEEHIAVQRETKARTILLQSLPEDHMADFHHLDEAFVKRDTPNKLESRSIKCIFVGYPKETIEASGSTIEFDEIQSENAQPSENTSLHQHETVGSKWLFKKKTDMDGNIHTYKACLVVKGFTQTYEVDYEETFSPVADIKAIRILIAITTYYDYEIWQMDVKTAFLNGRLNEDVYMVQPERMDTSKCGTIPMQPNVDLSNTQGPSTPAEVKRMKGIPYASAVGSIMYAVRGAVDWKSSKQSTTTTSFMEAEYIVAAETAMEAIWIRAITIVNEPSVQRGAKHFRRKYHFIREAIQEGDIRILKVHTDDNLADPFTKPMPCTKHVEHARSIGLRPAGKKGVWLSGLSRVTGSSLGVRLGDEGFCEDDSDIMVLKF